GAALFGLGGFTWAHLVHTSMINALISVPLVIWTLEWSWERGAWRGIVLGALTLACQVFAGHLQDVLLTSSIVACYGVYRFFTAEAGLSRWREPGTAIAMIGLGILISAVQWVPSKELLDRSPRAGGLSYKDLTYASWSPELLPSVLVHEAFGTRARDTDWMDGYYPYHEVDVYLGLVGLALAVIGAGGVGLRDRWVNFWVVLAAVGGLLMLGKYTFLFDYAPKIPVLGSSREPVRFHLWVALATAALAAVGLERLARREPVRLRPALIFVSSLFVASIPILLYVYPIFRNDPERSATSYHVDRDHWLVRQLVQSALRDALILLAGFGTCLWASRTRLAAGRSWLVWILPVLILAELLGAHAEDVPTVPPAYWTSPPETVHWLKAEPGFIRLFGDGDKHSGEPGYASEPIDFMASRDALEWSLAAVWGLATSTGETPMISSRLHDYYDAAHVGAGRFDLESVTHVVTGKSLRSLFQPNEQVGAAFIHRNLGAMPRVRLAGRPVYAEDQARAIVALRRLGGQARRRLVVEDPTEPIPSTVEVTGTAWIEAEIPERVTIRTESPAASYLVLADTFDLGWTATVDGRPAPIRPAYVAFRAVALLPGSHTVVFTYQPAGFVQGLWWSACGLALALGLWLIPRRQFMRAADHHSLNRAGRLRSGLVVTVVVIIAVSAVQVTPEGTLKLHDRWTNSFHWFTWGAGIKAMKQNRQ
ncbi:MAG: YfhO family protein, partial [Planctomycetaceae bacterium]|nr:YfhO family protein [Planctomycetaceae bacterium]